MKGSHIPNRDRTAFKQMQSEGPLYAHPKGDIGWWSRVIELTAIGAGADSKGQCTICYELSNATYKLVLHSRPRCYAFNYSGTLEEVQF